jgi:hypothetical protein
MAQRKWKKDYGYSDAAMKSLERGTYGKETGRTAKYKTSQEQTQQAKTLPTLKGMTKEPTQVNIQQEMNKEPKTTVSENKTVSENTVPKTEQKKNTDNYVVHRDRYDKLMQNSRLANDIKTLAQVNYGNADQDATVSKEWAENYGAKNITGGYTKKQYLDTLSRRYDLTPKELNDMALTFHSDANKAETAQYGEGLQRAGEKLPVLASLGSFIGTLGSGVEGLYNAVAGGITGDDRYLSNMFRTTKNAPREGAKSNIDSNAGKAIYDIGMGVGDMATGAVAGSAPAILAGNTANEAQASAIDRGSSVRKASAYGTAAGALDYVTNTIGLDKAKDLAVNGIKSSGIKKILAQSAIAGAGEAGENLIQDLGQSFIDSIINGKNSELSTSYANKIASGMSESDALKETAKEYAGQLAMSAGTGFAMGSAMQGGSTIAKNLPEIKSDLGQFNMDNRGAVDIDALFGRNPELQEIINRDPGSFDKAELAEIKTKKKDVTAQLKQKNAEIRAQEEVLNNAPKKDRVAEKQKLDALNKEAQELQLVKKIYNHVGKGEAVPTKSLLMPNDYNNIFNEQTGTANAINVAVKFAGDTPQAKQLGREAKQLLTKYVNSNDMNDYYEFLGKVGDLSNLAEAKKADYVTKGGTYKYDDIYGGTITDKAGNDIANTLYNAIDNGSIPEIVNNTRNKIYKNVGDVHKTLTPDSAPVEPIANEPTPTDGQLTPEEVAVLQDVVDGKYDIPETGNEIPTVKPTPERVPEVPNEPPIDTTRLTLNEGAGDTGKSSFFPQEQPAGNVPPSNGGRPPINLTQDANGDVVESGTSRHIRAEDTPMKYDTDDIVQSDFVKDPQMYKQLKNADTKALGDAIYDSGDTPITLNGKTYEGNAEAKFRQLLDEKNPAAHQLGKRLADDYSAQGNHDMAAQVYRDMGKALTESGQFSQAAVISMMKNDPMTALSYMEKELKALNKNGKEKYGKKWKNFELTDEEKAMFDDIKPGDTEAIKRAYDKVGERIEREYPVSWWEKILEGRRIAMLFNTRTIMRNFAANPPTAALRYISDRIEGVGQYVANLIDPDIERTQAITGSNLKTRKLAAQIFKSDEVQQMLKETPGRLSEVPKVGDYAKKKQVFKGGIVSNFINKLTDNGIEKLNAKMGAHGAKSVLELGRNAAYGALEITDMPFVRENFISRLGSYMKVKGIDNVDDVPDEAIQIALEEALKATYKDNSWLVQGLRKFKDATATIGNNIVPGVRIGDMASQAVIPFVQAPGNIGARVVDYSAIGGTKGIADIIGGAKKGNANLIRKGIEEFSKGATGTMMAGLGMALYKAGIITGTYSDDKDQKAFEKQNGFREFALRYNVGGKTKYDTIDWMQPYIDVLMRGVLLQQAIDGSDEYDSDILRYFGHEGTALGKGIGVARETAKKQMNYFFDSTPLQNFGDLFKSKANGDTDIAGNLWENTVEDFAGALVPSAVNALTKTADPVQRQTYDPSNKFATFINGVGAKLPVVSGKLPTKYDTWGEPMTYGDSKVEAGFAKMLYPGEHTTDTADEIDNEINRLFDETQEKGVFPQVAPNAVDGEKLTAKEVSNYQKSLGERNRQLAEVFIKSNSYNNLSDADKASTLNKLFQTSNAMAANEIKGKAISDDYSKGAAAYESGGAEGLVGLYESKQALKDADISSSTNAAKEITELYSEGKVKEAQMKTEQAVKDNAERIKYNQEHGTDIKLGDWQKNHGAGTKTTTSSTPKTTTTPKTNTTQNSVTTKSQPQASNTTADTKEYQKYIDRAGKQNRKFTNDIPKLKELNYSNSEMYTYAYAINQDSSLTPQTFNTQYKKLDLDGNGSMKQDEMIEYFNRNNTSEQQANYLWKTYGENKGASWKTVPVLKNGTWKKSK